MESTMGWKMQQGNGNDKKNRGEVYIDNNVK